jgi:hypothetical protein
VAVVVWAAVIVASFVGAYRSHAGAGATGVVVGFSYPVVPQGKARIRVQLSAAHSREDLEFAVAQFAAVSQDLGLA